MTPKILLYLEKSEKNAYYDHATPNGKLLSKRKMVTIRFLSVSSLFNGFIPLIAIQMNTLKHGDIEGNIPQFEFLGIKTALPIGHILMQDQGDQRQDQKMCVLRASLFNYFLNVQIINIE